MGKTERLENPDSGTLLGLLTTHLGPWSSIQVLPTTRRGSVAQSGGVCQLNLLDMVNVDGYL